MNRLFDFGHGFSQIFYAK